MKNLLIFLLALTFVSCNPFISKDLRKKKRCNKKLERVVNRCPELLNNDTIIDTVIIEVPKVEIDSFIVVKKDTAEIDSLVNLIKNKKTREVIREYITKYVPFKDTVIHLVDGYKVSFYSKGGNIHYSIDKPVEVIKIENEVIVPVIKPIELTTIEKIINFFSRFWWWFVIGLVLFIVGRTIKQYFF
jgi:hypothetical protein